MGKIKILYECLPKRERVLQTAYHRLAHYVYPKGETQQIKVEHVEPQSFQDKIAHKSIQFIRKSFDFITRYNATKMDQDGWIKRALILETVAGVPGMVGGMARHLKSLRSMQRDKGWIHHLLEEADNERFHLFVFLNSMQPTLFQRTMILGLQGIFFNMFFIAYLANPVFCHRFVGYLEEEAVKTYTRMLEEIQRPGSSLHSWMTLKPPREYTAYYMLPEDATMRDLIMCIRADEACHRATNHYLASVDQDMEIPEEFIQVFNDPQVYGAKVKNSTPQI